MAAIAQLYDGHSQQKNNTFCEAVFAFTAIEEAQINITWPTRFMHNVERTWLDREPYIDDI